MEDCIKGNWWFTTCLCRAKNNDKGIFSMLVFEVDHL